MNASIILHELRTPLGKLFARGTLEYCYKRLEDYLADVKHQDHVQISLEEAFQTDWTIMPYEIENF